MHINIILNDDGCQLRHPLSDSKCIYVKPFETCTCIGLCDIVRPIMLWVEPDGKCAIVHHCLKIIPVPKINYCSSLSPSRWHGQCQRRPRLNMACWSSTGWSWTKKSEGLFLCEAFTLGTQPPVGSRIKFKRASISLKSIMDVLPGTWLGPNLQEQT